MANEWKILHDKQIKGKRYVMIEDTINLRRYANYFNLKSSNAEIKTRFREQVREHRRELANKPIPLTFDNFEKTIGQL